MRLLARDVADRLESDPSLMGRVAELAAASRSSYAEQWQHIAAAGLGVVLAVLRSTGDRVQPLLTDNPLLSLVDEGRRLELVEQADAT